jgi:glycosyltransferase involved in cell wall biosynthesis
MTNSKKVSVIIATYNHGKYIKVAIDSVLAQTYRDFEVIIVDDGSTDHTRDIVASYGDSVKYLWQENQGLACARNTGIFESSSEFLAFLDADDYYARDNLEKKLDYLGINPDASWVFSDWQYVDEYNNFLDRGSTRFKFSNKKLTGKVFEELVYYRNFISPCSVAIRRSILEEVGYFDPCVLCQEDLDLWLRVSLQYPIHYINEVLVFVTVHSYSLSMDFSKWVYGNALIAEKLRNLIPGDLRNALKSYLLSIKQFPFQKRIYWSSVLIIIKMISRLVCYCNTSAKSEK